MLMQFHLRSFSYLRLNIYLVTVISNSAIAQMNPSYTYITSSLSGNIGSNTHQYPGDIIYGQEFQEYPVYMNYSKECLYVEAKKYRLSVHPKSSEQLNIRKYNCCLVHM